MAEQRTPWVRLLAVLVALLAISAVVAWQVDGVLAVRVKPADIPAEHLQAAPRTELAAAPAISAVEAPGDIRMRVAARTVADAMVARGRARPTIGPTDADGPRLRALLDPSVAGDEAYRISKQGADLVVSASSESGLATGFYTIADRIRSGEAVEADGEVVRPRLGMRLTDLGGVGLTDDPAAYRTDDYSLNSDVVGDALLKRSPYVDQQQVDKIAAQYRRLVEHSVAQGYNAVVVPGFLEYVTFEGLGVYPRGDEHVARAKAMVKAFGPVWAYAHELGMKVYFATDMLALSPPLEAYLKRTTGGLDTTSQRLWRVYQTGLRELFRQMPYASGLIIRIGEGGSAYQLPGWDYSSKIAVTTPAAVRAMLRALLAVAGPADKDVIIRTWSVGIGIGDLHTNPSVYEKVFEGLDDPHLVVSTKYSAGDYYSNLPLNPTLAIGRQRRIVEFQSRREFENYGALPNDLTTLNQTALQHFLQVNPHVEGVWAWAQTGGPLKAGPRTLYLRAGFWQLFELNQYATARLAADPTVPPSTITADWLRQTFSSDPATVAALSQAFALSRRTITDGLYIGPYARLSAHALGLDPPPMMWIFEWDILTGDSATLDTIYSLSRGQLDQAITEGDRAVRSSRRMRALVAATSPATYSSPELRRQLLDTLDYQTDLLQLLDAYRTTFLRYGQWIDTGSARADRQWRAAASRYERARARHLRRYGDSIDLPAYNLTAADTWVDLAHRNTTMTWLARGLLVLLLAALTWGSGLVGRTAGTAMGPGEVRSGLPGAPAGLRALWLGATRPWLLGQLEAPPTYADRVLVVVVPAVALVASRGILTSFAAPTHLAFTLGSWLAFALVARLLVGRRDPFRLYAAIGGVALLRSLLLTLVLVRRGPGRYWFDLWTAPGARSVYITLAFALFLALPVVTYVALRCGYGLSRTRSAGRLMAALGVPLGLVGLATMAVGFETVLTRWNDEIALLPWGLHRILGIIVYLQIPPSIPLVAAVAGGVLVVLGLLLGRPGDQPRRAA